MSADDPSQLPIDSEPAAPHVPSETPGSPESDAYVAAGLPPTSPDAVEEQGGDTMDNIVPSYGYALIPIVGLGGSAGGIPALTGFFEATPRDTGLAYVVVLHLSSEHESNLDLVLRRATSMPVTQARDGVRVEANHVYLIPPGKYLSCYDGRLRLTPLEPERGKRVAVDVFFRTLADTHGAHAAAVVLSGSDGDGAIGLKRIKERGGLTVAQDPDEAEHAGMPRSAIDTGMVDWVLRVAEMPARLGEYFGRERRVRLPAESGPPPGDVVSPAVDITEAALRDVLLFLRSRTGRDFTYYKRATILRRISRRMQINDVVSLPEYLNFLRTHAGEAGALLQDMLISVTNFFRDREAFRTLEVHLPELFRGKGPNDSLRVWVPACATGEEAYSVAMLLQEHARTLDTPPNVQVFATDLAEDAVGNAREGNFPAAITTDVSEERLARFFTKDRGGYRVRRELREMVLFAQHDLLKDSPFSKLDLVTCRNLLIYLNADAQRRALDVFHFALHPGGTLMLGTSETVDDASELFTALDKKNRLYRRRPALRQYLPLPLGESTLARTLQLQDRAAVEVAQLITVPAARPAGGPPPLPRLEARVPTGLATNGELFLRVFENFGPPTLVVDRQHRIVHLSGAAGRYLRFGVGAPSTDLLRAVHPALRMELSVALSRAEQTQAATVSPGVIVELPEGTETVDLHVTPAGDVALDHFLILVTPHAADEAGSTLSAAATDPVARHLERALETTKAHLRDVSEQYEASIEEQKAGNEELQAMNEELRSASEELETSREELQSINEELNTVNQELKSKLEALADANSDLQNLISSTNIATVFLDRTLRVTRYTPTAVPLFNLIPTDLGRPLTDLRPSFDYPEMRADAAGVLARLVPSEREVGREGEGWFLARILPYRTADDHIAGVVLTFVDITARKAGEEQLRRSEQEFRLFVQASSDTVYKMSPDWLEMRSLVGGEFLAPTERPSQTWLERYIPKSEQPKVTAAVEAAVRDKAISELEHRVYRGDGTIGWTLSRAIPLLDSGGNIVEWFGTAGDITERHQTEDALRESESRLAAVSNLVPILLFSTDPDGRLLWCNRRWTEYTGQSLEQAQGFGWLATVAPEDRRHARQGFLAAITEGVTFRSEHRLLGADGSTRWFQVQVDPSRDAAGNIVGWFGAKNDIDDLKQAAVQRRESEERLRLAGEAAGLGTCDWNYPAGEAIWNEQRFRLYGLEPHPERVMKPEDFYAAVHPDDRERVREVVTAGIESPEGRHAEEYRTVWPDGTVRWISETGRVVERLPDGRALRVLSVLMDITERRETERTLRESAERLRLATAAAHMYAWELDLVANTVRYSDNAAEVIGEEPPTDLSRALFNIHPEDRHKVRQAFDDAAQDHDQFDYEVRTFAPDGSLAWYHVSGMIVREEDGGPVRRAFGVSQDVTERKVAEETLRTSEERFRLIFESAKGMGIYTIDPQGFVTTWNPGAELLFGWTAAEAVGRSVQELLPEEEIQNRLLERNVEMATRDGRCEYEAWFIRRDGSRFWSSGVLSPLLDAEGKLTGFLKIMRDRTDELQSREAREYVERERARMLEVAQAARREAEEASAAKDHFLAVLSHELRTPLTPITMALGMLADRTDLTPRVRDALDMIERNVELEARFIDDLLDMTRIVRGKMEIVRQDMDFHEAVRRAVEVSTTDIKTRGQRLNVELSATDTRINGDAARLQQVMWNLLKNASKFTPDGGSITLRTYNRPGDLCAEVMDTGIGLEAEATERIFRAFEQADASIMKQFGGLGLGLAIAKATVDAHDGELSARSAGRGQGATFTVCLPLHRDASDALITAQKPDID